MSLMHFPQPHTLSVGTAVHQEFTAYVAFFFFFFFLTNNMVTDKFTI